jgi:hypothetical protein
MADVTTVGDYMQQFRSGTVGSDRFACAGTGPDTKNRLIDTDQPV